MHNLCIIFISAQMNTSYDNNTTTIHTLEKFEEIKMQTALTFQTSLLTQKSIPNYDIGDTKYCCVPRIGEISLLLVY